MQLAIARRNGRAHRVKNALHLLSNGRHKLQNLNRINKKVHLIYASSLKNLKKKPYASTGIILGVGLISGLVRWYKNKV